MSKLAEIAEQRVDLEVHCEQSCTYGYEITNVVFDTDRQKVIIEITDQD